MVKPSKSWQGCAYAILTLLVGIVQIGCVSSPDYCGIRGEVSAGGLVAKIVNVTISLEICIKKGAHDEKGNANGDIADAAVAAGGVCVGEAVGNGASDSSARRTAARDGDEDGNVGGTGSSR